MQLGTGGHARGECGLDVHVHVLQLCAPFELAFSNLRADGFEPGHDGGAFLFFQQPHVMQHPGVGDGAGDVVMREAGIELHRIGKRIRLSSGPAGKPSAARGDFAGFFLRHGTRTPCRVWRQKSRRESQPRRVGLQ